MRSIKSGGGLARGRGLSESVRLTWVYSFHWCSEIHNAITELTGSDHTISDLHVDLTEARINRDLSDSYKIRYWFNQF